MRAKTVYLTPLILAVLICISCFSSSNLTKSSSFKKPIPIAILPFENMSMDLKAGELMRLFFVIGMQEMGYQVQELAITDSILQSIGITDGGQLPSLTAQELHQKLNIQGLLYGTLVEATYSTSGITMKKKVTASVKIVKDGIEVWSDEETSKEGGLGNLANPLQGLAQQVVDKQFEKMFQNYAGHPLEAHIEAVTYKLQEKMPGEREEKSGWN